MQADDKIEEVAGDAVPESSEIRSGSPFAGEPIPRRNENPEQLQDIGALRYTAMGAVAAAVLVLGFGAVAAWWFPVGGLLIAGLGSALALFGLLSPHYLVASLLLVAHVGLFLISYGRAVV